MTKEPKPQQMKALSVKNPWAYLECIGIKDIENRTWPTSFRGRVLIHVSKKGANFWDSNVCFIVDNELRKLNTPEYTNSFGSIIGSVEIVDCVQNHPSIWAEKGTVKVFSKAKNKIIEKPIYNWVLKNPILFEKPILNVKGTLSFWNYEIEIPNNTMMINIPKHRWDFELPQTLES